MLTEITIKIVTEQDSMVAEDDIRSLLCGHYDISDITVEEFEQ